MPFWTKLYSNHTNLTGFSYNSDEKIIFQNSKKLSPVFRNIRDFFYANYTYNS